MPTGEGALILTNRRLLFLNRVPPGQRVDEALKKVTGQPMRMVLDQAMALDKNNFQIPLQNITRGRLGAFSWFPLPHFCLMVDYLDKSKQERTASFQFRRPMAEVVLRPQFYLDLEWAQTIGKAKKLHVDSPEKPTKNKAD